MSDAQQGGKQGDEADVVIDQEDATEKGASAPAPAGGIPLSKFAAPPPPAAGTPPSPNGVPTPKPGSLTKTDTPAKVAAVTEPAPPDADVPAISARAPAVASGDGLHVLFSGMTSVGLVREHNEDNLVIADLATKQRQPVGQTVASTISPQGALFAVCDGMGGAAAGEVASQMAVDFLFEQMAAGVFAADRDVLARHLVSVVERAGKQIFDTAQADRSRRGMGTTSTVAVLLDKVLFVAQVGDSRAYILRNGVLKQVTKDQSLVNQLIEAGHLTEEEAEAFEHSNIILQALGTSEKVVVDLTFVELRQSDRLLMCSDGLSGLVHAETIAETLRTVGDPVACCTRLTELANEGGGHDNITVIVADFTGNALPPPQSGETAGYNQYPLLPDGTPSAAPVAGGQQATGGSHEATDATREGVWQWWAMGLVAILIGVGIAWWWEHKKSSDAPNDGPPMVEPKPLPATGETAAPTDDPAPEPELVPAHITTDAETGLLLVDGEPRGPLAVNAPRDLDLAPGSYRIELQIDGSVAVSQVVTVESSKPLELVLTLPKGATADPAPAVEEETVQQEVAPRRARTSTVDGPTPASAPRAPTTPEAPATPSDPSNPTKAPVKRDLPANPF